MTQINNVLCLGVCLFICKCTNVKTAKPIEPNLFVGPRMTPGKALSQNHKKCYFKRFFVILRRLPCLILRVYTWPPQTEDIIVICLFNQKQLGQKGEFSISLQVGLGAFLVILIILSREQTERSRTIPSFRKKRTLRKHS